MITKVINVDVNTGDSNAELEKLEGSFKEVDKAAEKTNKSVDDVAGNGGAIAILDSLTGGLATRFRDAFEASKLFNLSLKGTRTALIATGIGAFVVALGLVVAYWTEINDLILQTNKNLERRLEILQSNQILLKGELGLIDKAIELQALQGKNTEELQKQRIEIVKRLQEQNELEIKALEIQIQRLENTQLESSIWEDIELAATRTFLGAEAAAKLQASRIGQNLIDIAELKSKLLDLTLTGKDLEITLFKALNGTQAGGDNGDPEKREKAVGLGFDAEQSQRDFEAREEENARKLQQELEFNLGLETIGEASARIRHDNEIKWADLTAEAKLGIAQNVLGGVANLVDEQSVAGKGIAIAQTGINTAQGIMQAFATLPTIPAIVAAALVGVTGVLQTQKIAKQKIPSATGRGFVSGGGGGSAQGGAPSFNLVAGTEGSQINDSINLGNNEPTRAVVVSGDVTTGQSVDRNIISESGI